MGTLCRLWDIVEKATNSNEQSVNASPDDMQKYMVGQSSNTVTYHRRYNLLNNLMGFSNQAKEALKEREIYSRSMMEIFKERSLEITLWK